MRGIKIRTEPRDKFCTLCPSENQVDPNRDYVELEINNSIIHFCGLCLDILADAIVAYKYNKTINDLKETP